MNVNSREEQLINEELKKTDGNISRVARVLGLDYFYLQQKYGKPSYTPFRPAVGPEPLDIRTLGRPSYEPYVIAVKKAGCRWPDKFDAIIADARKKFDAGTHEMFQTPNDGWVVQYLIPRASRAVSRTFFSTMVPML
ncbi:helix-turn-helix domain-containing protein [Mesorhizobium sp. M0016]|uniref:helix-turn-helix domain-containing protein n=1 Tax=Mesorhizobium sp. M0016 TaxID=2956843 RepID=UPI00333B142F